VPATIESITALEDTGDVEIILGGYDGRPYGASDVVSLELNGDDGVYGTLHYFKISGTLGTAAPVYTGTIKGPMDVVAVGQPLYATALDGDFTISDDCDPNIALEFGSISGTLTLGQTEGNPFAASVLVDGSVAAGGEIDLPAGLDADGLIDATSAWNGTLTCSGDLAGNVSAYSFQSSAWVHVTGELSGTLRAAMDVRGVIDAAELSGLLDVGRDLCANLYTGDITSDSQVLIGRDFRGYIEADDLAGTLDVGRDYRGSVYLWEDIAASGELTVGNDWGTSTSGGTAYLYVDWGSVDGRVSVTNDAVNAYIQVAYIGHGQQGARVDFEHDFQGEMLVLNYIGYGSVLRIAHDALGASDSNWIFVGHGYDPGPKGVAGSVIVGNELHIPLEVRSVAASGEIEIGSVPDPMAYDSIGVYGELLGSISVTGELDGECVIYVVADGGRLDVGGDMTALFEIMIYDSELEGYIDDGGVVHVEGAMSGGYAIDNIYAGGSLEAGSITSSGSIGLLAGSVLVEGDVTGDCSIDAFASSGSFEIDGELAADHRMDVNGDIPGTITIGELSGTLDATDWLTSAGVLDIGNVDGLLWCQDGAAGTLTLGSVTGTVNVGGPVPGERSSTTARITVEGSIGSSGQVIVGDLTDPGDANNPLSGGYVIVNGSLQEGGQIIARAGLASDTAFIAINYAGGTAASWEPNAPVTLEHGSGADEVFYGNTPDRHIWAASICRGDLNGDEVVDGDDVNPFIQALLYPDAYSVTFPGLGGIASDNYSGGGRIWHGDANCDGSLNIGDINPFIALVISGCCDSVCPGCEDQDGGGGQLSPEELAKVLADSVSPELYDDLVAIVAANIDLQPDEDSQAYWEAVYAALTE